MTWSTLYTTSTNDLVFANTTTTYPYAIAQAPFPIPVMITFDPNKHGKYAMPEWATFAPKRKPSWKVHANLGHAKNAVGQNGDIILYQWRSDVGQWTERYRQEQSDPNYKRPENCPLCGANLLKESSYRPGSKYYVGKSFWDPREELVRLTTCRNCEDQIRK